MGMLFKMFVRFLRILLLRFPRDGDIMKDLHRHVNPFVCHRRALTEAVELRGFAI
jgi:hypothetical protein